MLNKKINYRIIIPGIFLLSGLYFSLGAIQNEATEQEFRAGKGATYQTDTLNISEFCIGITDPEDGIDPAPVKTYSFPCILLKCMFLSDTCLIYSYQEHKDTLEVKITTRLISSAQLKKNVRKGYAYSGVDAELTDEYIDANYSKGVRELDRIEIKHNATDILLPAELYRGRLFPHLRAGNKESVPVFLSADPGYIFISIWGSDGAGTYNNLYLLSKEGTASRYNLQYGTGEYQPDPNFPDMFGNKNDTCKIYRIGSTGGRL
jgi:hypothetical protein